MKKVDSKSCYEGIFDHSNIAIDWEYLNKIGFCVMGKKEEVRNSLICSEFFSFFFSIFRAYVMETVEVQLFGKTKLIKGEPI